MAGRRSVSNILNTVLRGGGARRRRPPAAVGASVIPAKPRCAGACLFERKKGGPLCRFCDNPPAHAHARAARRAGGARVRNCRPESVEQDLGIALLRSIGCRDDKTGKETDIWVYGSKRPRDLPKKGHSTFTTPGTPDVRAQLPLVAPFAAPGATPAVELRWEVKADDGRPSAAQLNYQAGCQARGLHHVMGGVEALRTFLVQQGFLQESR